MSSIGVISGQPQAIEMSGGQCGVPQSVQYLSSLDTVVVRQKIEAIEALTGFETKNKYQIMNKDFQQIFFAREESDSCERAFCAPTRGFVIHVTDNQNYEIMRFVRQFKYCMGCCWCGEGCCNMSISIESPPGKCLGRVTTGDSKCANFIKIMDASDNHIYTIWVPHCICQDVCCPADVVIPVTDPSLTQEIGRIAKVWRGCCTEIIGDADSFRIEFPAQMPLDNKILMMGALFFVDYLRFEKN